MQKKHRSGSKEGVKLFSVGVLTIPLLLTDCARTMASGDAGCISYAEARLVMPDAATVPIGKWGEWIADTDDRMTGTCR